MQVTIWSDFVCPFCYAGTENLYAAIEEFNETKEVEVNIEYLSFLLDPEAEYIEGEKYLDSLRNSKGMSDEQLEGAKQSMLHVAHSAGLEYDVDNMKLANTMDAHRVFQFAKQNDKGKEFFSRLYKAVFEEGKVISDHETLIDLSVEVGLPRLTVKNILDDETMNQQEVIQDILIAQQVGVQGVPFFVFENKYAISGAQPKEQFLALMQAIEDGSIGDKVSQ